MWSSRLFLRLFLAYASLFVLAIFACSAIVAGWQEEQLVKQVHRRLHDSAILLRENLGSEAFESQESPSESDKRVQQRVRALSDQTRTRFTLIDAEGRVLAESERKSLEAVEAMENHLIRQELVAARQNGRGRARRLSPTMQEPYFYNVISVERQGEIVGYVRAAEPTAYVMSEVAAVRELIWLAGLLVGLAGLVVTYWLTSHIVRPIRDLTAAAKEMAAGHSPAKVRIASNDEIGTLAGAFQNMVERLGARESALRESADRQTTVLGGMTDGVLAVDEQQRVLFANAAAGEMLGFLPEQVEELQLLEAVRSNDLSELAKLVLSTGEPSQCDIQWQVQSPRSLVVKATPLPGSPCPGVVLVLHDVTELKRLEGLRQQFVANVSHELKTPLSSIKAYTETLLSGALDNRDTAVRFLDRIDDQASRLHELIMDMLSLARIESGNSRIELTTTSLTAVAESCILDNEQRANAAQVELINEIAQTNMHVHADQEALRQVINNLLDNGLKYTPPGGSVRLSCHTEGEMAVIEVADSGPGIAPDHHDRLFERFYRVDKARSRELGGTGLGLAIVKHLCEEMGGNVSVISNLGKGSIFCVRIPLSQ